jgi:hypothetical protein
LCQERLSRLQLFRRLGTCHRDTRCDLFRDAHDIGLFRTKLSRFVRGEPGVAQRRLGRSTGNLLFRGTSPFQRLRRSSQLTKFNGHLSPSQISQFRFRFRGSSL